MGFNLVGGIKPPQHDIMFIDTTTESVNMKASEQVVEKAIQQFSGNILDLERALGVLAVGPYFGWRVLYLIHDKRILRRYQNILGVDFRELFPERGPYSHKSVALRLADKFGNYWKVAKGEAPGLRSLELQ